MKSLLVLALSASALIAGDGSMFRNDLRHLGVYSTTPLHRFRDVQWTFATGGAVRSTPVVHNGTMYVGSADGHLYALDQRTGAEKWRFATGGAVMSSVTVEGGLVLVSSRDNVLYAVDVRSAKLKWKHTMGSTRPYQWEFDYWLSSPTVFEGVVYVGGGDGLMYALDLKSGSVKWTFDTGARVRTTAAVADGMIFFGNMAGWMFALNAKTGALKWKFATEGTRINTSAWGFDRNSILSSAAVADSLVVFGGRDGFLYAVDEFTGMERWRVDHKVSWITGSPAIHEGAVYTGTSDGRFVQAVDLRTGVEKWRTPTGDIVWSSPAVCGPLVYIVDNSATVFALDRITGKIVWRYTTPGRSFSSTVIHDGVLYFGCDDGYVYALSGETSPVEAIEPRKAVYWEKSSGYNYFQYGIDEAIRDDFARNGYAKVDGDKLAAFMQQTVTDGHPSVVVFAAHRVPASVLGDTTERALIRRYLNAGGRVVFLGPNPLAFKRDSSDNLVELSFLYPQRVLGIQYHGADFDGFVGFHDARPTAEGKRWGLRQGWVGTCAVDPVQVSTVLALDENGRAAAWLKRYGSSPWGGLLQLWLPADRFPDLVTIRNVAEHGS